MSSRCRTTRWRTARTHPPCFPWSSQGPPLATPGVCRPTASRLADRRGRKKTLCVLEGAFHPGAALSAYRYPGSLTASDNLGEGIGQSLALAGIDVHEGRVELAVLLYELRRGGNPGSVRITGFCDLGGSE